MLNLDPIKKRLEQTTTGEWCYKQDELRGDWLVMYGSQLIAACRYPKDASAFAFYRKDMDSLIKEVEQLRQLLGEMANSWDSYNPDYLRDPEDYTKIENAAIKARKLLDA